MQILIISLKKNFFSFIFLAFLIFLITFSNSNLIAAKQGIELWYTSVLPTLFPFFIATELLYKSNFVNILSTLFKKFMRPLFNVPETSAIAFILGNLSGYPTGAKLASNLLENKMCTKTEAERLITFSNNSGPLFILGTVGISMFYNKQIGILLLITHFLSSITVGLIFRNWKTNTYHYAQKLQNEPSNTTISISNFGEILGNSIKTSINLILNIGGFIVLFSVIISILNNLNIFQFLSQFLLHFGISENYTKAFFYGFLEITNGLKFSSSIETKNLSINIILSSSILGFGGLSILFQVYSVIAKSGISIKPYFYGKLLQAFFAGFYTYLGLLIFPYLAFPI